MPYSSLYCLPRGTLFHTVQAQRTCLVRVSRQFVSLLPQVLLLPFHTCSSLSPIPLAFLCWSKCFLVLASTLASLSKCSGVLFSLSNFVAVSLLSSTSVATACFPFTAGSTLISSAMPTVAADCTPWVWVEPEALSSLGCSTPLCAHFSADTVLGWIFIAGCKFVLLIR